MSEQLKVTVSQGDIATRKTPVAVVNLFQGVRKPAGATGAVDAACGGMISRALKQGDFKGKLGETLVLYPEAGCAAERVMLVGLGGKDDFDAEAARKVAGAMANALRGLKVKSATTVLHGGDSGGEPELLARGLTEGLLLGTYRYHAYFRDGRAEPLVLNTVTIVESDKTRLKSIQGGVKVGTAVATSMNLARDLINGPPNEVTPTYLGETAKRLGRQHGFKVTVMNRAQCEKLGMGSFLAVAQGSAEPCKFIVMEYEGTKNPKSTVCLVGKGITFDSGGISLKPGADMDLMKFDMGGSAAVLGGMNFAATHKVPMRVVGIIAATENLPGGRAYKPGDILTAMSGVTIDIKNTDAEGRLVLADALTYAERYKPDAVVDLATLTGACVIALGNATAIMGNDEWLLDQVQHAGNTSGERVWPLPLWSEYREKVQSTVADIRNSAGREAGSITAGAFLGAFTNAYRWVHMDIAGAAWNDANTPYMVQGGAAGGVRTLCQLLMDWKAPQGAGPKPGPRTSLRSLPDNATAGIPGKGRRGAKSAKPAAARTRKASGGAGTR